MTFRFHQASGVATPPMYKESRPDDGPGPVVGDHHGDGPGDSLPFRPYIYIPNGPADGGQRPLGADSQSTLISFETFTGSGAGNPVSTLPAAGTFEVVAEVHNVGNGATFALQVEFWHWVSIIQEPGRVVHLYELFALKNGITLMTGSAVSIRSGPWKPRVPTGTSAGDVMICVFDPVFDPPLCDLLVPGTSFTVSVDHHLSHRMFSQI